MRNSHAVRVCITLLMFHQRLSRRYWMLFKQSADIIIKGHRELAGCAVWKLRAKETDGLWRRRKTIFKVNTATECAVWPHLLHVIKLQTTFCRKKNTHSGCTHMKESRGNGAPVRIRWSQSCVLLTHKSTFDLFWNLSAVLKRLLHPHTQKLELWNIY